MENDRTLGVLFLSPTVFPKELFCVARVNCFWHFSRRGPASWSWYGRVYWFRAQNGTVDCFSDRRL